MKDNAVHEFLIYISSEKGLLANTLEAYERDITKFINLLKKKFPI